MLSRTDILCQVLPEQLRNVKCCLQGLHQRGGISRKIPSSRSYIFLLGKQVYNPDTSSIFSRSIAHEEKQYVPLDMIGSIGARNRAQDLPCASRTPQCSIILLTFIYLMASQQLDYRRKYSINWLQYQAQKFNNMLMLSSRNVYVY